MNKQKPLTGEVICPIHSDRHVGSHIGLSPKKWHTFRGKERIELSPSPVQQIINAQWEDSWNWIFKQQLPIVAFDNADGIEGDHNGIFGIWSKNPMEQAGVAIDILLPKRQKCQRWYATKGTPAHVGEMGQWDEYVAKELGATTDQTDEFASPHWKVNVSGTLWDVAHQGPRPGRSLHKFGDSVRAFGKDVVLRQLAQGNRPPDVIVRSHVHVAVHEIVKLYDHECHVIITPALQGKTEYATKISSEDDVADIGIAWVKVCDGKVLDVDFRKLRLTASRTMTA